MPFVIRIFTYIYIHIHVGIVNCVRMSRHKFQVRLHGIETLGQVGRVGLTKNVPIETG